ncbi:HAD-IA family hydrolase [Ochrobactrum sp. SFR4]|uniref:HAD-IA family hydrolase n=1 Tax=Ochrobactrum sp. SFR4 TaxID=2717368 RepID=UPI00257018CA|nr:HAD-IA family hydrolase [Ochrobactrum sp. SFR4]
MSLQIRFIILPHSALKNRIIHFSKKATKLSKLRPEEIVLIDDTLANIIAAKECGWHAIHWKNESCLATELAQL